MEEFKHEYDLEKTVLITPKKRDFKMLVTPRYVGHYCENVYEEFTADLLSNMMKDEACFIDIGAHSGFYTLLVGTNHRNARIFAFEPVPENFSLLVKNLELNGLKNIQAYNIAVSDRDETKLFNITEASDSAGFYRHPLTSTIKTMEVRTVALDNFLKDFSGLPIVVKIDTEGHELHVLEGMRKIIDETEDIRLVVEFNPSCLTSGGSQPNSLLEMIDQLGFEIFFIDDQCRQTYKLGENIDRWTNIIADRIYLNLLCIKKQKSLSVCFFSHSSNLLGAERSLLELTSELVRNHGVICSVVLPDDGPLRPEIEKVGASTLVVNYSWWCDWSLPTDDEIILRLSDSFKAILDQIATFKKIAPDIIFTNTLVIPWGAIVASFLGRPHLWFIHEFGRLDHSFKFYLSFRKTLEFIKGSSNLIFTNSKAVRKSLFGETSDENILTIYYNIEIPPNAHNQGEGLNYFTRDEATKLVITGSITETKGQEDAILAVKELIDKKKDIELIIMGPASLPYLKELEEIVGDENLKGHVHFYGFKENPYPVINQADIVLLCSEREAFGRVTVEAMLLKKPVIGTNSGATPELIREGYNGLLYEPGDYRQLADKIEYLIENREKIVELGENGFEFAKTLFTKEKYGGEVYQRLIDLRSASNLTSSPYFGFVTDRLLDLQAAAKAQWEAVAVERDGFAQTVSQLQATVQSQQQMLARKEEEISGLNELVKQKDIAQARLEEQTIQFQATMQARERVLAQNETDMTNLKVEQKRLAGELQAKDTTLNRIYESHGWKALLAYYNLRNKLLPENTRRRVFAKRVFRAIVGPTKQLSSRQQVASNASSQNTEEGRDAETQVSQSGDQVAFSVATNHVSHTVDFISSSTIRLYYRTKIGIWKLVRVGFRRLPLSFSQKQQLKYRLFGTSGSVIENMQAKYRQRQSKKWASPRTIAEPMLKSATFFTQPIEKYETADETNEGHRVLARRISELRKSELDSLELKPFRMLSINETAIHSHAKLVRFSAPEIVQVSIVIPVFNKLKYTLECLTTLMRNTKGVSYEIIVVDDGSTDETPKVLSLVENITCIVNDENLGFVYACNRGAAAARGDYVLFLNNDTQVTENWLKPLVDTFQEHDRVGAVGPKIVYPSGHLQEAGALVNRDGTSSLVGLSGDPDLPRYNYVREVMYCSGACLLVETKTFKELHGFDVDLAPAYCEDWDLAFRLRARGLRVIYNPNSVVIHHLSVTSDDVDDGFKMDCVIRNQQKLAEKWQREIDHLNTIRIIAFYLPQFHPIPENDRWWGKGFTEWTNVSKARPNFVGHYQPHLPADLGFYDLRVEDVMEQQADLAKRYGIYGFCYFYYWFAGKRLLGLPLERILKTDRPNIPFCLCWANENWTRKWDGLEQEVLVAQRHSDEDDHAVIRDLMRYMRHQNYIRVDGKPLLIVYRANLFPDIKRTANIWRELCLKEGLGEIYLAMAESFEHSLVLEHPSKYGLDASVEFPPHGMYAPMNPPGEVLNPEFAGIIHDYPEVILRCLEKKAPGFVRFRSVMPSWDNTPRRQNEPVMLENARPAIYQAWLETILDQTHEQNFSDERIVFINAWNEWGEGNHIEPDRRYGHGFLEATRNAQDAWLTKRKSGSD